jgi:cell division protein FtsW (lipid II flippase)
MPAWKVLVIAALSCLCLALAISTVAIPLAHDGAQRWLSLGVLLAATLATAVTLALFVPYARDSYRTAHRWA